MLHIIPVYQAHWFEAFCPMHTCMIWVLWISATCTCRVCTWTCWSCFHRSFWPILHYCLFIKVFITSISIACYPWNFVMLWVIIIVVTITSSIIAWLVAVTLLPFVGDLLQVCPILSIHSVTDTTECQVFWTSL